MHTQFSWTFVACMVALCVMGCGQKREQPRENTPATAAPSAETTAKATPAPAADTPAAWPDGWLVTTEQEWIPVLNRAGEELRTARAAFLAGDRQKAASSVRAAADAIQKDADQRTDQDKDRLSSAATQLRALADRLDQKTAQVSRESFDNELVNAYRSDATVTWLYLEQDAWAPTFERPREHFQRAFEALKAGDNARAASEIRRGSSYFRLAAQSARADDRELLNKEVSRIDALAAQAQSGKLTQDELRRALAQVDTVYAESYLHVAEDAYRQKNRQQSGRALREAAARLRSRAQWAGDEIKEGSTKLADELDQLGSAISRDAKIAAKDVTSLLKRARDALQGQGSEASHREHAG